MEDTMAGDEPGTRGRGEARLRHEFVGMMFAVTIGEVGLQFAPLVHEGNFLHWLPAYSHILLATVLIATSWVGWSLSVSPGARRDMSGVFQWEFSLLLLDVSMVICYFVLVRAVNFERGGTHEIASAEYVAKMVLVIFGLYFAWDFITKVLIYWRDRRRGVESKDWGPELARMGPTLFCLFLAVWLSRIAASADDVHRLTVDLALLSLVLLFRGLKELVSALLPQAPDASTASGPKRPLWVVAAWTFVSLAGLASGAVSTIYALPLPSNVVTAIHSR
jgi:hypothetical protein